MLDSIIDKDGELVASSITVIALIIGTTMVLGFKLLRSEDHDATVYYKNYKIPSFLINASADYQPQIAVLLSKAAGNDVANDGPLISDDDSLIKVIRQLEFWIKESKSSTLMQQSDLLKLTKRLIHVASWRDRCGLTSAMPSSTPFRIPKVRFGRTELQMPIITCGSMRFQDSWMPDFIPLVGSNTQASIQSPSQKNLIHVIRQCLQVGINHFETARCYGTSEAQLCEALHTMLERKEIQRSDFILQTKIPVRSDSAEAFEGFLEQSWTIFSKLGHIDLLSMWVVSAPHQVSWALLDDDVSPMGVLQKWKQEGKIKHIGFSTHGSQQTILRMINSNKFDYVNLHHHYFGDYHAVGTMEEPGHDKKATEDLMQRRQGNWICVQRAKELDMGILGISPNDKGGRLYQPSSTLARTIGPELSPIAFAALYAWQHAEIHTLTIGFARPSDLDEMVEAAELFASTKKSTNKPWMSAHDRLTVLANRKLGKEWNSKSLLNLPSCYEACTGGVSVGHIVWTYNVLMAYGMYQYAKMMYTKLQTTNKWNHKKTAEENIKAMETGNPGHSYDSKRVGDLTEALQNHYDPRGALIKIKNAHELLNTRFKHTQEQLQALGWDDAYDLRTWREFPDTDFASSNKLGVVLQSVTHGRMGVGGGQTKEVKSFGTDLRDVLLRQKVTAETGRAKAE